jgi:uncharacterized protein
MTTALDDLIAASIAGDVKRVSALLDHDASLISATTMLGSTAIHAAHHSGRFDVVSLLLSRGRPFDATLMAELGLAGELQTALEGTPALVKEFNPAGSTLLHGACYWGNVEAARLLLDRGADPNLATTDSFLQIRPLGCAVASPDVPNPSEDEAVVLALVDLLLDHGADVNGRRRDGMTALHSAGYRGHLAVIRRLVERGGDPAIRANDATGAHAGQTPSETALSQGQETAAELLRALA